MGTEVLRPQDCLVERVRVVPTAFSRRRYGNGGFNPSYYYNSNINSNGNGRFSRKPVQRKRVGLEQVIPKRSNSVDDLKTVRNNVKMEKVTILRRGESLDSKIKSNSGGREDGLVVTGTEKVVDTKSPVSGKSDVYAGSAIFVSPEPSSLPLPSFSKKKQISIDDSATRDLRRLLRLDF